jgi:hypothetical protein
MRDHLAHRYFDTAHAILQATVDDDLPELERAVRAMAKHCPRKTSPARTLPAKAHPAKKSCQAKNRQRIRRLRPDIGKHAHADERKLPPACLCVDRNSHAIDTAP